MMVSRLVYLKDFQHMLASLVQLLVSQGASGILQYNLVAAASRELSSRAGKNETVCTKSCDVQSKRPRECPGLTLRLKGGAVFSSGLKDFAKLSLVNSLPPCDGLHVSVFPVPYPCAEEGLRSKPRPRERSLEDKGPLERKWVWMRS